MILLEGFLVRLMIGITKNPSKRITKVTFLSKRTRLQKEETEKSYGFDKKNIYIKNWIRKKREKEKGV